MFGIQNAVIEPASLQKKYSNPEAGAVVSFEGRVRNHNLGSAVKSLEYEGYAEMSIMEGQKVMQKALVQFDIEQAYAVHRLGHLHIGDIAVWVICTSKHRRAAFRACEYIIDELKLSLPIWKKEYYLDGRAEWVFCPQCEGARGHHKGHHHISVEQISAR